MATKIKSLRGGVTASGVPIVTGYLSPFDRLVYTGHRRGMKYEIYRGVRGRTAKRPFPTTFIAVVYSSFVREDGSHGVEAEEIGYGRDQGTAVAKTDDYIERLWRGETFGYRARRHKHLSYENPLTTNEWLTGAGIALGIIGAITVIRSL